MNRRQRQGRRRWIAAVAIATASGLFLVALIHAPALVSGTGMNGGEKNSGQVRVTTVGGANAALSEEALYFDPTPLFLPTEWNAAQNDKNAAQIKAAHREPGNVFAAFQPTWAFSDLALDVGFAEPLPVPENSTKYLVEGAVPALTGMGRAETEVAVLPARGAFVTVRNTATGQIVYQHALPDARPPGDGLWQPIELDTDIDASGMIGSLVVSQPSDVEGIDDYFRHYLAQSQHLGQLLSPGFYHLVVGP